MSDLRWTAESRREVDEVYDFIARRDRRPATADKVVADLILACESLAEIFSSGSIIGTARPDLGDDTRLFTHKRWVIAFRPIDAGIEVQRVLDGSRDFSQIFNPQA
jgi:plasmid stabilization system protein ParE